MYISPFYPIGLRNHHQNSNKTRPIPTSALLLPSRTVYQKSEPFKKQTNTSHVHCSPREFRKTSHVSSGPTRITQPTVSSATPSPPNQPLNHGPICENLCLIVPPTELRAGKPPTKSHRFKSLSSYTTEFYFALSSSRLIFNFT